MPIEIYERNGNFWRRGSYEIEGEQIARYERASLNTNEFHVAVARLESWKKQQRDRHFFGEVAVYNFAYAVSIYLGKSGADTSDKNLKRFIRLVEEFGEVSVNEITAEQIREFARRALPDACTDTWRREVLVPASAAINYCHRKHRTLPISIGKFDTEERVAQDKSRGKKSREERRHSTAEWIEAFCAAADPYNAAMAKFMFETAARIDQAVSITPDDVDLANQQVFLKAQKGHEAQWVKISQQMVDMLAGLEPKRPRNRRMGYDCDVRVFGYASPTGYLNRWKTICRDAKIEFLTAHRAGRHGFFTNAVNVHGISPIIAAKAGRWQRADVPLKFYAHADKGDEENVREQMSRTSHVQAQKHKSAKQLKEQ